MPHSGSNSELHSTDLLLVVKHGIEKCCPCLVRTILSYLDRYEAVDSNVSNAQDSLMSHSSDDTVDITSGIGEEGHGYELGNLEVARPCHHSRDEQNLLSEVHDDPTTANGEEELTLKEAEPETIRSDGKEHLKACSICCDHPETHACHPCGHVACKECLSEWKSTHDTCMLCMKQVVSIVQIIPNHSLEEHDSLSELEEKYQSVLRQLLRIKSSLVVDEVTLHTSLVHLSELARSISQGEVLSRGEIQSVAAVEILTIEDSMTRISSAYLSQATAEQRNEYGHWDGVELSLRDVLEVLNSGKLLNQHCDREQLRELSKCIRTQWNETKSLLNSCLDTKLPQVFHIANFLEGSTGVSLTGQGTIFVVYQQLLLSAQQKSSSTEMLLSLVWSAETE